MLYHSSHMPANQSTRLDSNISSIDFIYKKSTHEALTQACNLFVKHTPSNTELWAASRDWFMEEWGRDTFISLSGLLLTTKRYEEARQVFRHFAKLEQNGLIPNVIKDDAIDYNTSDASLWFIHATKQYMRSSRDTDFVKELMPTIKNIIDGYKNGIVYERNDRPQNIYMDRNDGLIVTPAQSTWMDADPAGDGSTIITPRNGKCIEINGLWYEALVFYDEVRQDLSSDDDQEVSEIISLLKESFLKKFWNAQAGYLNDVVDGDPKGSQLRPNQVIALAYAGDLIPLEFSIKAMHAIRTKLLTPGGLRTLSRDDPDYIGSYDTFKPMSEKDPAYHQGSAWPWLIGPYCDALVPIRTARGVSRTDIKEEVAQIIAPLVKFCLDSEFKSIPELFSGNPPYEPGGTTSQAWSVSEILRIMEIWC